jgi:hypothetical protein
MIDDSLPCAIHLLPLFAGYEPATRSMGEICR